VPLSQERTEQFSTTPGNPQQAPPPPPPIPPGPTERLATPGQEPPAGKKRKRSIKDPLSLLLIGIIVVSLLVAGLIGGELYARHVADTKVAEAVACEVKDQATASFGVAPLLLWQLATQHYTNISVSTAGNQIRDARGMKIQIGIKDVQLNRSSTSKGTIGALDATITWTTEGIKESVQNAIPMLGPFVTSSVTTHPADGTVELKGTLDDITAKPVVSGTGIDLQIQSFNALGFTLPKESVQTALDAFTSNLTKNYPLGIHADSVQVTDSGVISHFSTQNATIPAGNDNDPCFANI
jgi:LmeA-like phospholipid-binding